MALRILLIAPNLSRTMGGEALKALQICQGLVDRGHTVCQITHARVRDEMTRDFPHLDMAYLPDGRVQAGLASLQLQALLSLLNAWQLARLARRLAKEFRPDVIHVTSPISPVLPLFDLDHPSVILGPINGNIAYPPAFEDREPLTRRWARRLMPVVQKLFGWADHQKRKARILVAGGTRTRIALAHAGISSDAMVDTLDSGIAPGLFEIEPLVPRGRNPRFVHIGRLVAYKGCDLAIEALALSDDDLTLDVIGDGPERAALERLAASKGLSHRVNFLGWQTPDENYYRMLQSYRALVLPTLAEANGIVFQEAMVLGLPIIAVDWGGAAQLLEDTTAILVKPHSAASVTHEIADALAGLAGDAQRAARMAQLARRRAEAAGFSWPQLLSTWEAIYASR